MLVNLRAVFITALITPFAPCFIMTKSWGPSGGFYLDQVNPKVLSFNGHMPQPKALYFDLTKKGLLLVGLS